MTGTVSSRAGGPAVRSIRRALGRPPRGGGPRRSRPASTASGSTTTSPDRSHGATDVLECWTVLTRSGRRRATAHDRLARAQRRQPGRRHAGRHGGDAPGGERRPAPARRRCRRRPGHAVRGRAAAPSDARCPATRPARRGSRGDDRHAPAGVVRSGRRCRRVPAAGALTSRDRRWLRTEDGRAGRTRSATGSTLPPVPCSVTCSTSPVRRTRGWAGSGDLHRHDVRCPRRPAPGEPRCPSRDHDGATALHPSQSSAWLPPLDGADATSLCSDILRRHSFCCG